MITGIDHVVVAVASVEAAEEVMERDLGLAVTGGGRHETMGTYNRLAFLGDTYVELIGVFDRGLVLSSTQFAVGRAALAHLEAHGDGLATYALACGALSAEVAGLRAAGSPIGVPVAGSRRRPDGEEVRWVTAFPELGPERPPFLIEHEMTGAEWGAGARAARAAFRHPGAGVTRLAGLELAVRDAGATAHGYGEALGIAFSEGWRAAVGPQWVALVEDGGGPPVVVLEGEEGSTPLDTERFGVRWVRMPRGAGEADA